MLIISFPVVPFVLAAFMTVVVGAAICEDHFAGACAIVFTSVFSYIFAYGLAALAEKL